MCRIEAFESILGQHVLANHLDQISIAEIEEIVNREALRPYTRHQISLILEVCSFDNYEINLMILPENKWTFWWFEAFLAWATWNHQYRNFHNIAVLLVLILAYFFLNRECRIPTELWSGMELFELFSQEIFFCLEVYHDGDKLSCAPGRSLHPHYPPTTVCLTLCTVVSEHISLHESNLWKTALFIILFPMNESHSNSVFVCPSSLHYPVSSGIFCQDMTKG